MRVKENRIANDYRYSLLSFIDKDDLVLDGDGHTLDGMHQVVHLLELHNCHNCVVRNLTFRNGNTEALSKVKPSDLPKRKVLSIFGLIDGGAVVITGDTNVTFENCDFIANNSVLCGGAVSNQSTGTVTFHNCTFQSNRAGHTGSAIDNLTTGSSVQIEGCKFHNNISNTWYKSNAPHGQVSLFPKTSAMITNCSFRGGSIPFDYYNNSTIRLSHNTFVDYDDWDPTTPTVRDRRLFISILKEKISLFRKFLPVGWKLIRKTRLNRGSYGYQLTLTKGQ